MLAWTKCLAPAQKWLEEKRTETISRDVDSAPAAVSVVAGESAAAAAEADAAQKAAERSEGPIVEAGVEDEDASDAKATAQNKHRTLYEVAELVGAAEDPEPAEEPSEEPSVAEAADSEAAADGVEKDAAAPVEDDSPDDVAAAEPDTRKTGFAGATQKAVFAAADPAALTAILPQVAKGCNITRGAVAWKAPKGSFAQV